MENPQRLSLYEGVGCKQMATEKYSSYISKKRLDIVISVMYNIIEVIIC